MKTILTFFICLTTLLAQAQVLYKNKLEKIDKILVDSNISDFEDNEYDDLLILKKKVQKRNCFFC